MQIEKRLDTYQREAEHLLTDLICEVRATSMSRARKQAGLFNRAKHALLKFSRRERKKEIKGGGIYLYGGVGRGKTMLMDVFFENCQKIACVKRFHYHNFMHLMHEALHQQRKLIDVEQDALIETTLYKVIGKECVVLCLDEMEVIDITDAMLMARLFREFCRRKLFLVTTSNTAPDDLYKNGLQRELFLPFVKMLKNYVIVYSLESLHDYRVGSGKKTSWFSGRKEATQGALYRLFESWQTNKNVPAGGLEISLASHKRVIQATHRKHDKVWFAFSCLCERPLSSRDFIKLAHKFRYIAIEGVPRLADLPTDVLRRFVVLVDILYDEEIEIGMSSLPLCKEADLREYFVREDGERYGVLRLVSRLQEML